MRRRQERWQEVRCIQRRQSENGEGQQRDKDNKSTGIRDAHGHKVSPLQRTNTTFFAKDTQLAVQTRAFCSPSFGTSIPIFLDVRKRHPVPRRLVIVSPKAACILRRTRDRTFLTGRMAVSHSSDSPFIAAWRSFRDRATVS